MGYMSSGTSQSFSDSGPHGATGEPEDRAIGEIIGQTKNLTADQVERILSYQKEKGIRFGEAAVALGLASSADVLWALSQQFHYPYAPDGKQRLNAELIAANEPFSPQAEAFRAVRSQLIMRLFSGEKPHRAVAVVSPDVGDGKTYFAANIAVAFSQLGGRTLLVDADLRSPRLHQVFRAEPVTMGLSSILSGRSGGNVILPIPSFPSLFLLPVGTIPPNPLELVERPAFGLLMRELSSKFDYIIVDTPAAAYGSDSAVIANRCGAVLTIGRQNKSRMNSLHGLLATLQVAGVEQAGVVINEY